MKPFIHTSYVFIIFRCTVITGTPTMYVDILSHIKGKSNLPIKLHIALAAGAPCSPELIRQMNKQMNTDFVSVSTVI